MKKLSLCAIALSSLIYANEGGISIAKNDIEKVIELSPDRNLPQNKAIKENLKTKDDYIKTQEAKKDFEAKKKALKEKLQENKASEETNSQTNTNSNNNTTTTKKVITKYKFIITNENTSFKKLGIKEEDLQLLISEFSTKKFSLQDLQDISNIIAYYFQVNGYPAATAYVPQQEFEDSVQINIALGTLGKYIIKNKTTIKDYFVESKLNERIKGKIISTKLIEDSVYKVNEMYGVQTLAGLQAGENVGETDIVIEVEPDTKADILLYADNYGIESAGDIRAGISMGFNSLFNMGDYYNFYLQSSNENQINYGASYTFFLGNLKITPSISQGTYSLGGEYKEVGFSGTSRNFGIDFSYPVWINTNSSLYFTSSIYHKILKDEPFSNIFENYSIDKHSNVGSMGLEGLFRGFENNTLSYSAKVSVGKVNDDGATMFGNTSKSGGKGFGWFRKLNASVNNYYSINEYITHTLNINYQKVLGNFELDSSESSSLGGAYGVRAYDNGEGDGDNTIVANFGLRINIPNTNFYFTPFYDIGYAWYEKDGGRLTDEHFLDAVGLQILYNKPNEYYIKLDGARAVHQYKYDDDHRMKLYLSGGIYF
ncbi:ShlB/FhaC/HecB family hemolysin secretion/activation protein [Campylobacter lari]|uniref:ShlB/FhaC/HecB family hemolysin secretion/activation protein n=1 Tax=Campylobacter lari TaxID=201 RepID=UPI0008C72671|nr:ShlB/FhaC/HecB family hemolysin secretion/activation protein [Campylobacter lari]EAC1840511.1 ShlB/FhaC/HecB family hemolysin secretion/activation protein [Campylobacter lari]EAH6292286.1 ShlB/FhaC/HecB family hemolysin secretion/activation protein [Campylobacter lari]EAH7781159.1 ShlB/FhaC/HecB family hemolysin secretion/activation protein [Campylobacter lari]EAH8420529.1 ShlB/FhaC/HecB family hemolysin secretion/activation protein [Campylobacter lari]EAI0903401.1 ShlB/FhaC/HecB family hem